MELLKREASHRILAIGEYIINGGFVRRERADSGIWKVRFAAEGSAARLGRVRLLPWSVRAFAKRAFARHRPLFLTEQGYSDRIAGE